MNPSQVEIVELLESIAGYWNLAVGEIWSALSNPHNAPIFMSSLIKFSIGPTIAFALSQWSFRDQEKKRREKEERIRQETQEATRAILRLEIDYNLKRLLDWEVELFAMITILGNSSLHDSVTLRLPTFQKLGFEGNIDEIAHIFSKQEVISVFEFYNSIDTICPKSSSDRDKVSSVSILDNCKTRTRRILDRGNPLREKPWNEETFRQEMELLLE